MKNYHPIVFVFSFLFLFAPTVHVFGESSSVAGIKPEEFNPLILQRIDSIVEKAIAAQKMPGCVVCIGRSNGTAFLKAYGNKKVFPKESLPVPMTSDTLFDLASLTKPIATATSIMILVEQGKLKLDSPVAEYLTEFQTPEKQAITIRQLLLHTAGFIPDNALSDYQNGIEKAKERLLALKPDKEPGTDFRYSDVSFQLLGILVERVSGYRLNEFSRNNIFEPLGMKETCFVPNEDLSKKAAPTQDRELGQVHDPRAFRLDGVAGHAGLFSTAEDLAVFAKMLLNQGEIKNRAKILKPETVQLMTAVNIIPEGYRCLGWDMQTGYSGNRGKTMSPSAFGHGGFTGTSLWIDPALDLFVIFLSNRVHPDGKGSVNSLAGEIGTIAADAVSNLPLQTDRINSARETVEHYQKLVPKNTALKTKNVLPGIDLLQKDQFTVLRGKRVGLITNHSGISHSGISVIKLFRDVSDMKLSAIFTPEHGLTGTLDQEIIGDYHDSVTGTKVYSLYGKVRRPTPEMLENIDILVFDIQDIGTRFYTYISTMLYCMEAAAMQKIPFVILDRPNPIRGDRVEGSMLDAGNECFVACFRLPVRHGMTVGELALMMNDKRRLELNLHIVPCNGWTRNMDFTATSLTWVNPSPNMRSLTEEYLYPGIGLLEFTNLSVGRGTETPFEIIGAPYIDGEELVTELKKQNIPEIQFESCRFTPKTSIFANTECGGIRFRLGNPETFQPVRFGVLLATTLHKLYPDKWETKNLDTLLLHRQTRQMILEGKPISEIEAVWQPELNQFLEDRKPFLLYE
ncbi:MAG: DUF1343 domain-containing protein [Planctomycetaceae bacterium]|jgi:uncharacterized protein YbbC (DUF1343 family)/CubicO group peptidase (beta-lactamase class C family)|nr:DUF1343 domain-containing protein [Planctomycetaceae bacterium]